MATLPQWWPRANKSAARPRTPRLPAALRGADAVDGRCGRRGDDHRLLRVQLFGKNNYADALEQSVTAHTHGAHLVTRWRAFMAATRIIHAAGAFLTVNCSYKRGSHKQAAADGLVFVQFPSAAPRDYLDVPSAIHG